MSSAPPAFIAFSVLRHEATQQLLAKPKPWPLTKQKWVTSMASWVRVPEVYYIYNIN